MRRCRVPVWQTDGFWGLSSGTHLMFICLLSQWPGYRHIAYWCISA